MISYIIVNFKSTKSIHQIIKKISDGSNSIYVVDCSNDYISILNESVITPSNNRNIGFGKAVNLAVSKQKNPTKYLFLINPDVNFKSSDISKMLSCALEPQIGAVCSISNGSHNFIKTSVFRKKIGIFEEIKMSFTSYKKSLVRNKLSRKNPDSIDIDYLDAGFCLINYESFMRSGGFPEEIFMYGEDLVLSERIRKAGFRIVLNDEVKVNHPGGGTFGGSTIMKLKRLLYSATGCGKAISIIRNDKKFIVYTISFLIILIFRKLFRSKSEIENITLKLDIEE